VLASTYALDDASAVADGADIFAFSDVKEGKSDVIRITGNAKPARVALLGPRAVRTAIATNASHVFWIQSDAIVRAPKAGGEASIVAKVTAANVQRIVADDAHVYWTDHGRGDPMWMGRVYRASLADGTVTPISDVETPTGIALDADTVYWTSLGGGRILARKKSGGDTFVLARDQRGPFAVVVDAHHVYWTNVNDGNVCRADKTPRAQP
jgi:sugar lactone lactonase YvrE